MHDCVVIGGGVIGLSLAYELAGHGLSVHLLERGEPGCEASWAGAGMLPPALRRQGDPAIEQLAGLSHELHPIWAAELLESTGIDNGYRRTGAIYVARNATSVTLLDQQIATWRSRGIRAEALGAEVLPDIEPSLAVANTQNSTWCAYLTPDEGQLRNPRHLKALQAACRLRGVEISTETPVEDFSIERGRIAHVLTPHGPVSAASICIAAGSWTGTLAKRLGVAPSIKPVRGQMVLLSAAGMAPRHIINDGPMYLVPRDDGRVLVGSTEEDVGFACHTTTKGIAGLLDFALSLFPPLAGAAVERTWAGLRPGTADGSPYLGRVPGFDNLYIAAGHFRAGLQLSVATAVVMGELMRGLTPQIDLTPFRLDR